MKQPTIFAGDPDFVRIFIETSGALDLANVGRFLQRLDTGARKIAKEQGWHNPSIEIASLATGSLDLKIKIAGLRVAQGSLAVSLAALGLGLAQYLKSEPAASKSTYELLNNDRATNIIIEGGGSATVIQSNDLPDPELRIAQSIRRATSLTGGDLILTGQQGGTIRLSGKDPFIELDARPGLLIQVQDRRQGASEPLVDGGTYIFDGEAHVPRSGRSFFVLRSATLVSL